MTGYSEGVRVEREVIAHLKDNGYATIRGASSKGLADVVGIKEGQVLLVNVKRTDPPGPAERAELIRVAGLLPGVGVPLVALHPFRQELVFRRLTGAEPKAWVPWVADQIIDNTGGTS